MPVRPVLLACAALLGAAPVLGSVLGPILGSASGSASAQETARPRAAATEAAAVRRAITLMDRGLFDQAREALEPLVAARDPDATYVLGYIHARGLGTPADETTARRLFVAAAMDGQPDAQFALGELAYAGRGVRRDRARAYEWYDLAAAKGHPKALYMLGVMHAEGRHAPQDLTRAADLYARAAAAGSAPAMHQLGVLHLEGRGVAQSYVEAARWFEAAAREGDAESQYNLALLHDSERLPGEPDLTTAVRWMRQAAASGMPRAQIAMGLFALRGRGTEQSDEAARAWFARAAEGGDAEGLFLHAAALAEGLGGEADRAGALAQAEAALRASAGEPIEVIAERRALRDQLRAALAVPRPAPTRGAPSAARVAAVQMPEAEAPPEEGAARIDRTPSLGTPPAVAAAPPMPPKRRNGLR